MTSATVEFARSDEIGVIHLNRPSRLNAVSDALVDELLTTLSLALDSDVRALVLAGRGRAFCAGHDLKEEPVALPPIDARARLERIQDVTRMIRRAPFPVIAAVHGYALGAGCEFALGCDLVVADETARFGFPEVSVGLSVTGGISRLLTQTVGVLKAKELILLGEHFTAEQAACYGLVARLVPAGTHETAALALAGTLVGRPPFALSLAKQLIDQGLDGTLEGAFSREVTGALLTEQTGENAQPRAEFAR